MMIASAIAIPAMRLPRATFWSSSSSFQILPGVSLSKIRNAAQNSTTPSSANTTAAMKFDPRFDTIVVSMSFPPAVAGSVVDVVRAVRARIVAHGARDVLDLGRPARRPAGPLDRGYAQQQQHADREVDGMLPHSSSLSDSAGA